MAAADQHQISHHEPVYPTTAGTGMPTKNIVYQPFTLISFSYFGATDGRYFRPLHCPGALSIGRRAGTLGLERVVAAAGRLRGVRLPEPSEWPVVTERPRQPLARPRRQLDPDARHRAHDRHLLLHLHRPAVDRQGMAVAGPAGSRLQPRWLGRRDGVGCRGTRRHLRAAAAPPDARPQTVTRTAVHRCGLRPDRVTLPRAPACAGLSADAPVGSGPGALGRAAACARLPGVAL